MMHIDKAEFIAWRHSDEPNPVTIDKVIFLDIDGVLNDESRNYKQGVIIDHKMVQCLQEIVLATEAQIILSSSWRLDYLHFVEADYTTDDKHLIALDTALTEAGLSVRGITPITPWTGPGSRPAEIRLWLKKNKVSSYVILDDDDFWMWEEYELRSHVVLTKIEKGYQFLRGLNKDQAQQAIHVLNAPNIPVT